MQLEDYPFLHVFCIKELLEQCRSPPGLFFIFEIFRKWRTSPWQSQADCRISGTERKMQYQEYDLKAEQTIINQEAQQIQVIPSREDSYERLLEEHNLPADEQTDIETIVLSKMMRQQLHEAIRSLQEEERYLIIQLFYAEE